MESDTVYRRNGVSSWCSKGCFKQRPSFQVRSAESRNAGADIPGAAASGRKLADKARLKRAAMKRKPRKPGLDVPPETRQLVLARDRCCRYCGTTQNLHVHHIYYRSGGVDHQPHNLIVLCHEHHTLVHSDLRRWRPLLLGVIWCQYAGQRLTVRQLETRVVRNDGLGS